MQVGTNAYVDVAGRGADVGLSASGTLEFWAAPTAKGPLVVQSNGTHWENQLLAVYAEATDDKYHVGFANGSASQHDLVSTSDIAFNATTHIVVTWDQAPGRSTSMGSLMRRAC